MRNREQTISACLVVTATSALSLTSGASMTLETTFDILVDQGSEAYDVLRDFCEQYGWAMSDSEIAPALRPYPYWIDARSAAVADGFGESLTSNTDLSGYVESIYNGSTCCMGFQRSQFANQQDWYAFAWSIVRYG